MIMTTKIESFVMHCGEMGSRWGFNRTVGQMYGLLTIHDEPLTALQISEALNISRGNVSMGIKELQSWRLVQVQHKPKDRKEYYSPAGSIWEMAIRIFEERRKREVDPTLSLLRDNLLDEPANSQEQYAQERMHEMHDLLETMTHWASELQSMSPDKLNTLMKLGAGVSKVIDMKDKFMKKS
ncbi:MULTISPECIES: GbsR/MarR family transcriptional regulator [unclassified Colwellia]|uniref:GbsR/MarR family transcriptional regulator n=1 Tax=unclassified Colwellia TaxID=196834 RepID=UPI0015F40EDB|nr:MULTISPECIES: MarR family transcriptional regulator [unclassified Colwellia]MBA6230855.1 transcriptional regulator [Colwellia sp. MB02u-7]MBA6234786.1 transcriptional regulator [Colwellia sp. MB02u-11]MBA6255649.1 transcriptional regulator [Colwellia sp. MB3u-28]MBA6261790.1 transcriptional regulator [Colwellia sp. MB3u-41]MBA6301341.1 transcriptional regulator [Colwellia sp. MB3u-22]